MREEDQESSSETERRGRDERARRVSRDKGERGDEKGEETVKSKTASILVKNLSRRVRSSDLREEYEKYGEIRDVYIPLNYYTREPKGYAFVEFINKNDADTAIKETDDKEFFDHRISVTLARDRRKTPDEMRRNSRRYSSRNERSSRPRSHEREDRRKRYRSRSRSRSASRGHRSSRRRSRS